MTMTTPALAVEKRGFAASVAKGTYVGIVVVMTAIVLVGFWPFFSGLLIGGSSAHWMIHLHAAVFSGWMLLLFLQAFLVFRRRVRLHQALGRFGIYYGVLVLLLGLVVTFLAPVQHVTSGRSSVDEAAGFLILPLGDMVLFAGFFIPGIVHRRKKELHKRLMMLATIALLFPAAARAAADAGPVAVLVLWLLPLGLAIAHDVATRRRVDRVYLVGAGVLLLAFGRVALMESEIWLPIGRHLITTFSRL